MKKLVFLTITLASLLVLPAFAVGLTEADYDYLATQDVKRGSPVLNALSPKEQSDCTRSSTIRDRQGSVGAGQNGARRADRI